MAYCNSTDLLLGDVPTSTAAAPDKYVADAADEIDSKIGHIYVTPVAIVDPDPPAEPLPITRPARLLLKRLNVWLATGRLLMAADVSGEENGVHAYALKLVQDATVALDMIASGEVVLEGAPKNPEYSTSSPGPVYAVTDAESNVEAFYDRIANPTYVYPDFELYRPWPPGYRQGIVAGG